MQKQEPRLKRQHRLFPRRQLRPEQTKRTALRHKCPTDQLDDVIGLPLGKVFGIEQLACDQQIELCTQTVAAHFAQQFVGSLALRRRPQPALHIHQIVPDELRTRPDEHTRVKKQLTRWDIAPLQIGFRRKPQTAGVARRDRPATKLRRRNVGL